jgi:urea transport system permease protein
LGYNVPKLKVGLFVMVSVIAGFAGSLFYLHDGIVSPSAVGVTASTQVLLWVALGGRGTLIGPIVGTITLQHLTATLSGTLLDTWLLIIGVLLIAVVMIFPSGIMGYLGKGSAK